MLRVLTSVFVRYWPLGALRPAGWRWGGIGTLLPLLLLGGAGSLRAQAPDWSFDSSAYENTLTATVAVTIDGEPSDSADVLGAFVGDQVRGTARPDPSVGTGQALYFLTVYGNESGPTIRFRVYDASADTVRRAQRTISFEPDATYGTPSNPFLIEIGEEEVPGVEAWTVDPTAYEQTMTVTASVFVEPYEERAEGPADRVAAFVNGEVRGVAEPERVGGSTLFFLTIYGDPPDAGQALRLRYYDAQTDRIFPTEETDLTFQSNAVEGSPSDPVSLVATRPSAEIEGVLRLEGIAPHPLDRAALVRFAADRRVHVELVLYDAMGRPVEVLYQGVVNDGRVYRRWLRGKDLASGTYFLRLKGATTSVTKTVVVVH